MLIIFYTADLHLSHQNIIKYCGRPFKSVKEMDKIIIKNINKRIKPDDMLYILGDFSFHADRYIDKVNGYKILIKGNHDDKKHYKLFDEVHDELRESIGVFKCLLSHHPYYYNKKVDFVICGHVHEKWKINGNNVNVGVDQRGFKPVSFDELKKELYELNHYRRKYGWDIDEQ